MKVALALGLLCSTAICWADAASVYRKLKNSIVKVVARDSVGTGVVVGDGTWVLTARHVVEDAVNSIVIAGKDVRVSIELQSVGLDVAILRTSRPVGKPAILSKTIPATGSKVYAIGHALGFLDSSISEGIISGIRGQGYERKIQFTAPISNGCSGGPLVNDAGQVVGIILGMFTRGQNLNIALNSITVNSGYMFAKGEAVKATKAMAATARTASPKPLAKKVVLGKLGQALAACAIRASASPQARIYYRTKPYDYLVIQSSKSPGWFKVMLENGMFGYVQSENVARLPFEVTADKKPDVRPKAPALSPRTGSWADLLLQIYPELVNMSPPSAASVLALRMVGFGRMMEFFTVYEEGLAAIGSLASRVFPISASLDNKYDNHLKVGIPVESWEELQTGDRVYWRPVREVVAGIMTSPTTFVFLDPTTGKFREAPISEKQFLGAFVTARRDYKGK